MIGTNLMTIGVTSVSMDIGQKFFLNGRSIPDSYLESLEKLEQLKMIEAGFNFYTFEIDGTSLSVDTPNQLEEARISKNID